MLPSANTITNTNKEDLYADLQTEECEIKGHKVGVLSRDYQEKFENFYTGFMNEEKMEDLDQKTLLIKF